MHALTRSAQLARPLPWPQGGRPVFDLGGAGIDTQSTDAPQFISKDRECRRLTGASVPILPFTS